MSKRDIELTIEKLVLEGLAIQDGERVKSAVERKLTRLLFDQGGFEGLAGNEGIAHLNGGQIAVTPGANADLAGTQIARAIYGAIKK